MKSHYTRSICIDIELLVMIRLSRIKDKLIQYIFKVERKLYFIENQTENKFF